MQRWLSCIGVGVLALLGTSTGQDPGERAKAAGFVRLLQDSSLRPMAERSLRSMGAEAIPALADALADLNSPVRGRAAALLGEIGPESETALRALQKATRDRDAGVRVAVCTARLELGERGEAVIQGLATALSAKDEAVRRAAAAGLQKAGTDAQSAIPALIAALDDRAETVRLQAAAALSDMGVVAVQALGEGTRSDSRIQRTAAVRALARLGSDAKAAISPLIERLNDDSDGVRVEAAIALGNIGPPAGEAAVELLRLLNAPLSRPDLRAATLLALDEISPRGWNTVATLRGMWKSKEALVRAFAAEELGKRKAEAALPDLMLGLNDMSHLVRAEAARALVRIAPGSDEVLALLRSGLADRLLLAPREAARALGEMGAKAAPAKAALQEAMLSGDEELARAAQEALRKIG
ncbi:MAG: HEAT repeat domain-containing protein [Planctomycetota bacterium]|jgi:HEAT repeat protein